MRLFTLLIVILCITGLTYDAHAGGSGSKNPKLTDTSLFSRTYLHTRPVNLEHRSVMNRKSKQQMTTGVVITYEDLTNHLALDKVRHAVFAESTSAQPLTMDVGGIDLDGNTPQNWNMPDLMPFASTSELIEHIDWVSTGLEIGYPDQTHAFYIPSSDYYEFYELNQDELFFYGFGTLDDDDEIYFDDWYLTEAPVPIEWGLDFIGTVIFIYEEDPDYDSLVLVQHYEVVADGTLQTYDEGPVNAVKLHFTEEITGYKDGQEVDYEVYHEVVWYSEDGHYLRGLLEEGASFTGLTSFENMRYQKISTSVSTEHFQSTGMALDLFPNPVSAGDVLTISHDSEIHYGLIQLFDMQGRLVQQMDLSGLGTVRNIQVQLPSNLVAGMYSYRVHASTGEPIGHGKLNLF